jgi:hypothetical protein
VRSVGQRRRSCRESVRVSTLGARGIEVALREWQGELMRLGVGRPPIFHEKTKYHSTT